jgi:palmitoyltransferase
LVLSVYCLVKKKEESGDLDGVTIAGVALSAMFGFFAFGMTATSGSYMLQNKTTVDMLRKDKVHQLAVRVPRGTPSTSAYRTITYPLSPYDGWPAPDTQIDGHDQAPLYSAPTNRDVQATRTFAILKTEPGENPWDLGPLENFKAVMGNTIWEWLLPIRHSPCCTHDSMDSDYQLGPVVARMARRVDLPRKRSKPERVEMVETNGSGR